MLLLCHVTSIHLFNCCLMLLLFASTSPSPVQRTEREWQPRNINRLYLNGQVNIDNVARSLLAAVSTSHVQPTHPSGNAAAAAATQQSPLLPHQQSIQQSHYHVPIPNAGHTNNSKFIASKSIRDKSRTRIDSLDTSHPGPIFLRHVTVGPRRNRMIIAFITVFVAISIIVVLSVFYTNQLDT